MKNKEIITKLRSVELCLTAHPDFEKDSEFEDRVLDLQEIQKVLILNKEVVKDSDTKAFDEWVKKFIPNTPIMIDGENMYLYKKELRTKREMISIYSVLKGFYKPKREQYTTILEFEVIKSQHEFETVGERLKLSMFGEYCPDASLRGYELEDILIKPQHYQPKVIVQKGKIISLNYANKCNCDNPVIRTAENGKEYCAICEKDIRY